MKLDYLKDKKEFVSVALLGVSVFLLILILIKVAGFFVVSASAKELVKKAFAQSKMDAKEMEKYFAKPKAIADELKKKNLFVPAPNQQPVKQVAGILGDEVLINGKWYKVGDMVGEAEIVAIEPTLIKIKWKGKETTLAPIDAVSPAGPGAPTRAKEDIEEVKRERAEMVQVQPERRPMPAFGGRMRFRNLSPEERAELRERFRGMSEEEREEFRAQRRERSDAGRRGND